MVKISVIIPCYNLGIYLDNCLEGISQQEVGEVEYIFVNDGSTDDTLQKLQEFCNDKIFCRIIDQKNGGVSSARNAAISVAKGEYLYLLDGDDRLEKGAVKKMLESVDKENCDAVLSGYTILRDGIESRHKLPLNDGLYTPMEIYQNVKVFPTKTQLLYKLDIIKKQHLWFDSGLRYGEVYDFTIRFFCFAQKVKVVSDSFFKYVIRPNSATHIPNYHKDLSILDTLNRYNQAGIKFLNIPSFNVTTFKMILSFTYNKYVRLKLKDKEALSNITLLLKNANVKKLIKTVAKCSASPLKERLLATYIYLTGVRGYKFLTRLSR